MLKWRNRWHEPLITLRNGFNFMFTCASRAEKNDESLSTFCYPGPSASQSQKWKIPQSAFDSRHSKVRNPFSAHFEGCIIFVIGIGVWEGTSGMSRDVPIFGLKSRSVSSKGKNWPQTQ